MIAQKVAFGPAFCGARALIVCGVLGSTQSNPLNPLTRHQTPTCSHRDAGALLLAQAPICTPSYTCGGAHAHVRQAHKGRRTTSELLHRGTHRHVGAYPYVPTRIQAHTHIHTHTHMQAGRQRCSGTRAHALTHTHTYAHRRRGMGTHTHPHTRMRERKCAPLASYCCPWKWHQSECPDARTVTQTQTLTLSLTRGTVNVPQVGSVGRL